MTAIRPLAVSFAALLAGSLLAGRAEAQTVTTRSEKTASGKTLRILASTNLKQDCSDGAPTEIKLAVPPANGTVSFKAGKAKTPASYRCPNKETNVEVLTYQSKPDFSGTDTVKLDIKTPDGKMLSQEIRISVEGGKSDDKKEEKKDGGSLGDL